MRVNKDGDLRKDRVSHNEDRLHYKVYKCRNPNCKEKEPFFKSKVIKPSCPFCDYGKVNRVKFGMLNGIRISISQLPEAKESKAIYTL